MITEFLISMLAGIVDGVLSIVPAWSIDTTAVTNVGSVGATLGGMNGWFPETFVLVCLGVLLLVRLWFLAWNAIQWLYHLIPFNG